MITYQQRLYLSFCNLLGARLFKKYWPVKGSYWNKRHTDTKKKNDLQIILDDADSYTQIHANFLMVELIILGLGSISGFTTTEKFWEYIPVAIVFHGYAFMIHHYNRILAKDALEKLPEKEKKKEDIKIYVEDEFYVLRYSSNYYSYDLSPRMKSRDMCEKFEEYVKSVIQNDFNKLEEYLFVNKSSLYQDFIRTMN